MQHRADVEALGDGRQADGLALPAPGRLCRRGRAEGGADGLRDETEGEEGVRHLLLRRRHLGGDGLHVILLAGQGDLEDGRGLTGVAEVDDVGVERLQQLRAGGDLARAFVPRALFGAYLAGRLEAALAETGGRLKRVRGDVGRVSDRPVPCVQIADGRRLEGTHVVLATGNLPPKPPHCRDSGVYDSPLFVPDPWRWEDLDGLSPDTPILLIGSGLTMVDVAVMLAGRGHRGPIWSVSRHGLLPHVHVDVAGRGPGCEPFLHSTEARDPVRALRLIRSAVARRGKGVPWQRVMDAVRPVVAKVWAGWPRVARERFLRHARTYWDIHRHRMAPRGFFRQALRSRPWRVILPDCGATPRHADAIGLALPACSAPESPCTGPARVHAVTATLKPASRRRLCRRKPLHPPDRCAI